jgi:hypothetical protein
MSEIHLNVVQASATLAIFQASATLVLVVITAWYAHTTKRMLHAMRLDSAAYLSIHFGVISGFVHAVLLNTGKLPAQDIHIRLESDKIGAKPAKMDTIYDLPFLKDGVKNLPPNGKYKYRVGYYDEEFIEKYNPEIVLHVTYNNGVEEYKETIRFKLLDLRSVIAGSFMDPVERLSHSLEQIRDACKSNHMNNGLPVFGNRNKNCPVCGELIHKEAKKCKHCLEWLPEDSVE